MRILHIIARWIGGGPERHILEVAKHHKQLDPDIQHRVLVLDRPISAPLFMMARRHGVVVIAAASDSEVDNEIASADVVEITYWNHPLLLELLRRALPPARFLIRSAIAGNTIPHILFSELIEFADAWLISAPLGHGAKRVHDDHHHVQTVPALADMSRLKDFSAQQHDGLRLAYLGSLLPTKLHPDFVDIVVAIKHIDTRIDLYGDADASSLVSLRQKLENLGVATRVSLHGHVESISQALSNADIFAYPLAPGSYVTSEKALQEAMWIGLPVVVLDGTAATGWIEDGVTGFVAHDITDFSRVILRLAADAALRHKVGQAARAYARRQFDPATNADLITKILRDVSQKPKQAHKPIPGANLCAADQFVQTLGELGPAFLSLVAGDTSAGLSDATCNREILLRGEGGVIHYGNSYPRDLKLKHWARALGYITLT
jgi:glycosyltransferase involved in cell wall biosynthesis